MRPRSQSYNAVTGHIVDLPNSRLVQPQAHFKVDRPQHDITNEGHRSGGNVPHHL